MSYSQCIRLDIEKNSNKNLGKIERNLQIISELSSLSDIEATKMQQNLKVTLKITKSQFQKIKSKIYKSKYLGQNLLETISKYD